MSGTRRLGMWLPRVGPPVQRWQRAGVFGRSCLRSSLRFSCSSSSFKTLNSSNSAMVRHFSSQEEMVPPEDALNFDPYKGWGEQKGEFRGEVKWWNEKDGYGYVTRSDGAEFYIDAEDIAESVVDMNGDPQDKNKGNPDKLDKLYAEMRVWFNLKKSEDGPLASDVKIVVPELAANPEMMELMLQEMQRQEEIAEKMVQEEGSQSELERQEMARKLEKSNIEHKPAPNKT